MKDAPIDNLDDIKKQISIVIDALEHDDSADILEYLELVNASIATDEAALMASLEMLKNAKTPAIKKLAEDLLKEWRPVGDFPVTDNSEQFADLDQLMIDLNKQVNDPDFDVLDALDEFEDNLELPAPPVSAPAKKVLNTGKVVIGNMLDKTQNAILVDAANEKTMNGNGGISGAIKQFYQGKGKLKEYVADILKFPMVRGNRCPNGEVKLTRTNGVDVIHASAPDLRQKSNCVKGSKAPTEEAQQKLFESYYNTYRMAYILNYGEDQKERSLSCPILGSGIYQWPPELSAEIAGRALIAFRRKYGNDVKIDFYTHPNDLKNGLTEEKIQRAIEKGFKTVAFAPVVDTQPKAVPVKDKTVGLKAPDKALPILPSASAKTAQPVATTPAVDPHKNAIMRFLDTVISDLKSPYANKEAKQNKVNDLNKYRIHPDPEISEKAEKLWPQVVSLAVGLILPQKPQHPASAFAKINVKELYEKERSVSGSDSLRSLARNAVKKVAFAKDPVRDDQIARIQKLIDDINQASNPKDRKECTQKFYYAVENLKSGINKNKAVVSPSSALAKVCDKLIAKIPEQELKEFKASNNDDKSSNQKHRRN